MTFEEYGNEFERLIDNRLEEVYKWLDVLLVSFTIS